jgi:hypothetical protein
MKFVGNTFQGDNEVVVHDHIRMWAERGLIHIEDDRDNSYKVVGVREMLYRMKAVQDMLKNSKQSQRQRHSHDRFDAALVEKNQKMLDRMVEVVRKAQEQGMPHDASARRDLARRRPLTIAVPGVGDSM